MWKVLFTSGAEKEVRALLKEGRLSDSDREVIATWIKQVQEFGPDSLGASSNFWHDHELFDAVSRVCGHAPSACRDAGVHVRVRRRRRKGSGRAESPR